MSDINIVVTDNPTNIVVQDVPIQISTTILGSQGLPGPAGADGASATGAFSIGNIVYTSGNQLISGFKTFGTGISTLYISGDSNNQGLIDNNGVQSVDWINRNLDDLNGVQSVSWGIRVLRDAVQNYSVEYSNRFLRDVAQNYVLDWNNRILSGNWTKDGNYLLTSIDSGNSQIQIDAERNKPSVTGLSINGAIARITGDIIFTSGPNIIIGQGANGFTFTTTIPAGFVLSGNLETTGSNLYNSLKNLSGQLDTTGSNLRNLITSLSGQFNITGSNLNNLINGLSGQLNISGTNLQTQINTLTTNLASTGQQDYNISINNATNISGNLFITGSNLQNQINSLGYGTIVYISGVQNIGGTKTFTGNLILFDNYPSGIGYTGVSGLVYKTGVSGQFYTNDSGNLISVDFYNRGLSGTWNAQNLIIVKGISGDGAKFNTISGAGGTLTVIDFVGNRILYNSIVSYDIFNRRIADAGGTLSVDGVNRTLQDSSSIAAVGWGNRVLNTSSNQTSIDWQNRQLSTSAAIISLDYGSRILSGVWIAQDLKISGNSLLTGDGRISGELNNTGSNLFNSIKSLSGQFDISGGNLQTQINTERNKATVTGISITGSSGITGILNWTAGSNITFTQTNLNTFSIAAAAGGSTITSAITGFGSTGIFPIFTANGSGVTNSTLVLDNINQLSLRSGVNAQVFNVYNTYTTTTNNEFGYVRWSGNVFEVGNYSGAFGAGSTIRDMSIRSAGNLNLIGSGNNVGIVLSGNSVNIASPNFNIPGFSFANNAGVVTAFELPIVTGIAAGTENSYAFNINGKPLLKIYAEYDGSSGIQNVRIILGQSGFKSDRLNIFAGMSGAAPGTTTLSIPASIPTYGGIDKLLGNPTHWLDILVSGLPYKIPLYG